MEVTPPISKYKNRKTEIDGIIFDSKREAAFYQELLICKKADKPEDRVVEIHFQPEFILQSAFTRRGQRIRKISYVADFRVLYADGHEEIIDVKGYRTEVYRIKRKMFLYKNPDVNFIEI